MDGREANAPFRAALYMRLSRDDEGVGESASISTQRDILRAFARAQGIAVAGEYADDGWSGTVFDRPDFLRMLRDIEAGEINCVLVKDLSRLGRNSARTAELLEEYFPRHGVRCIALGEGYDSLSLSGGMALAAPFMLLMNELYARDISQKIRASLRAKMEKGAFVSAFAPYGYRKDPADRNRLLADEEAAAVVRRIFRLAADGRRPSDIARELNAARIPTPAAYRAQRRAGAAGGAEQRAWSASMLCKLLRNRVYLGHTEHGKSTKLSFKSRETRAVPRKEWIVVKDTHEPLVSPELFEAAARRAAARRRPPGGGFVNLFSGVAVCADCGRNMSAAPARKKSRGGMLCCGSYKAHGARACSNHFLEYDVLHTVVQAELRALLTLTEAERETVLTALAREEDTRRRAEGAGAERLLHTKEKRLRELDTLIPELFEQAARGLLPEDTYRRLMADYEEERAALEASLPALKARCEAPAEAPAYSALLTAAERAEPLTPLFIKRFIARIEVGQGHYEKDAEGKRVKRQRIRIVYRFAEAGGETT